jgi:4-amino-4-deoxy-L-arabinose transferase-like glycosyltransferase
MAILEPTRYLLYRWRYVIGYSFIAVLLGAMLVFAGLYVPGGLSQAEMDAVVRGDALVLTDPTTWNTTSTPFYLFQKFLINAFGLSVFTIKLPSLIMALGSAIGLIFLLRRWFKPNIAVLASLIAVTTSQFLFIAQNAIPGVSYIFWPILLLLLGTQVTRAKRLRVVWKFAFSIAAALSLYTPLNIYPLIAIALAVALHPHLRNAFRQLSKVKLAICVILFGAVLAPLVINIFRNPVLGLNLLGYPSSGEINLMENIQTILQQYLLFWEPGMTTLMTPIFGLGTMLLLILGLYRLIRTRDTTRSYLIIIWLICLVPVIIINPRFTSVAFVPSVLLIAAGLTSLIGYWYRLFPFNPYARVAGLLPLIVLVAVLIGSGLDRYIYGYHYDPNSASTFSKDLKLLPRGTDQLIVSEREQPFYDVVAKYRDGLDVATAPTADEVVVSRAAKTDFAGYEVSRIITTEYGTDADRFYIYKKVTQ